MLLRIPGELAPGSAALSADCRAGGREDEILLYRTRKQAHTHGAREQARTQPPEHAHTPSSAPGAAICPARIMWRPVASRDPRACARSEHGSDDVESAGRDVSARVERGACRGRVVWMWIHPAAVEQVDEEVAELVRRCGLRIDCRHIGC